MTTHCIEVIITHALRVESSRSEKYSRGRRGAPAKGVGRATGARVQIPLSPLTTNRNFYRSCGFIFLSNQEEERRGVMIYTVLTKKAMKLCFEAHKDQVDKTGIPYVFHPIHLAEQMTDELSTVCALLHDVVEDTKYTFEDVRNMGFPEEVIEVLKLLTHEDEVPYMDYVREISKHPIATQVKLADLAHNSDTTRLDIVDEKAEARVKKYSDATKFLMGQK